MDRRNLSVVHAAVCGTLVNAYRESPDGDPGRTAPPTRRWYKRTLTAEDETAGRDPPPSPALGDYLARGRGTE